jgi:hypothetical protein
MMSDVSLETCWAIKKHMNNKFYYTVYTVGYFYKIFFLFNDNLSNEHNFIASNDKWL